MSKAILASTYGDPSVLRLVETTTASPGVGEVAVAVRAAGVNPSDLKRLVGMFGRDEAALPLRLGAEISGVVTAVGSAATGAVGPIAVGDEVIAFRVDGGFADELVVDVDSVFPKPAGLSWEEAAGLLLGATTAFHLVEAAAVGAGDRVLVHGASGAVGSLAVQLAVLRGAQVVGTARAADLEVVRAFGAEAVDYGEGLADRVRAVFADGVDAALNTADADTALDVSAELVADRDRIVTVTAFAHAAELGVKRLGMVPGGDPGTALRDATRAALVDLAGQGKIRVRVATTFPLAKAAAALDLVGSGRAGGKVILVP